MECVVGFKNLPKKHPKFGCAVTQHPKSQLRRRGALVARDCAELLNIEIIRMCSHPASEVPIKATWRFGCV
jgi:hypothetical protein